MIAQCDSLVAVISEVKCPAKTTEADYELIKVIGKGGFSVVYEGISIFSIVRDKYSGDIYAMKVIEKSSLDKPNKIQQIMNERNIMGFLDHPFIVKLHNSFQSKKKLHFVMDFCPGGELFYSVGLFDLQS